VIGDVRVVSARVPDGIAAADLRTLATEAKSRAGSEAGVIFFISADPESGKVPFIAAVTDAAVAAGVKAGDIIRTVAPYIGGRGGGKPAMAQGSGSDAAGIDTAVKAVRDVVADATGAK
jgi:alanyl-tRNA synthetase